MCGLAGWIGAPAEGIGEMMLRPLIPRGPDDQGWWETDSIHLGHRRLKVIDLEGGAQPMVRPDSVLTFNGEIYNYAELAAHHPEAYGLRGLGDTAVLQATLEARGADCLPDLRGMFAFAWYDRRDDSLLLARDAVGQKPLFYSELNDGGLVFGSTCRALRQHPRVSDTLDPMGLTSTLTGEAPREPHTMYRDIKALPPGSWLRWTRRGITKGVWWSWPETDFRSELSPERFEDLLATAVSRRLVSDVPLGVFLSGGLDSSSIALAASQAQGGTPLTTFSIGFDDASYDESHWAQLMAKHLGSTHHTATLTEADLLEQIEPALNSCDQPLADSSLLPTWLLCRLAKEHVTVCLSGDGGDDVMAGYDPFRALKMNGPLNLLPETWIHNLRQWAETRPPRNSNLPWPFKLAQFLRGYGVRGGEAGRRWMSAVNDPVMAKLLPEAPTDKWAPVHPDPGLDLIAWFRERYLRDQILVKVDRASMAHGLEVRNPLLDSDLLKAVARLPFEHLFHDDIGKWPLRRWANTRLPKAIVNRPKKGFGMPISQWLRGPLKPWINETLTTERLESLGLRPEPALTLRDAHLSGQADHRKAVWTLATLCHWSTRR